MSNRDRQTELPKQNHEQNNAQTHAQALRTEPDAGKTYFAVSYAFH